MSEQHGIRDSTELAGPSQRRRRPGRKPTRVERGLFLGALASGWTVSSSAERASVNKRRFYEWREADEAFAEAWAEAYEAGTDVLEDEVRRRALDGWDEDTFDGEGKLMRRVRRYAPNDLIVLLKARRPEYRDNARVEVTGRDGGPVELEAGYQPATLADVVRLARELGVVDVVEGEAVEVLEIESAS